ncbi:MAG TPA: plastocyanin/azurin family copper-binding protein [Solirubrobacteraceae bacterium]|jgi:plastocyanin|nr:plastocyanin/azurin family copper-binding protein [Solirubrobacteraceae bacterium]
MTPSSRAAALALGCSASVLAGGCGDDGAGATTTASVRVARPGGPAVKAATIDVASFKYRPQSVTLAAGGRVTWVNRDTAPHTAQNTGEDGPAQFDTGRLTRGRHRSITFSKPGTYTYYCVYHRFMEANVIVR